MFFKKVNIESYKDLIKSIILNEDLKNEIIDKIDYFKNNGEIILDGYNLYGKSKKGKDFLELKYQGKDFLCTYTEWEFSKFVTISEKELKNSFIKLERKEKVEYEYNDDITNSTGLKELEEIYDSNKNKIYDSSFVNNIEYITNHNVLEYINTSYFSNYFDLNKKWYISNGSIINYKLSKMIMDEQSKIEEIYSICPHSYNDGFITYYNFIELNEELFKQFMSGNITIDELLEKIDQEKFEKRLVKNLSKVDTI